MKTLFSALALLAACSHVLHAQSPAPVKMGLWETTATITVTGVQLPPQAAERMKALGLAIPGSTPQTTVYQGCITPETWQKALTQRDNDRMLKDCHDAIANTDARRMTIDTTCTTQSGTTTSHTELTFLTQERLHATNHTTSVTARTQQSIGADAVIDGTYLGADCKGIPAGGRIVSHK